MSKTFPVLWGYDRKDKAELQRLGCPTEVPWSLVAPHEKQAIATHDQSLKRLAERGGLSPLELVAVLTDRSCFAMPATTNDIIVPELLRLISEHTP